MCARYIAFTEHVSPVVVADLFGLVEVPALSPRYNVAPSQLVPVVGAKPDGRRGMSFFKWGFVPNWANDTTGPKPVNAKAETVAQSVLFGDSLRKRRCLVPADGFYEWAKAGYGRKRPFHFSLWDGGPFAFAGIWESWQGAGWNTLETFAVLTTEANELVRPAHDRMPVIVLPGRYGLWLDPAVQDPGELAPLLRPYPADAMRAVPVGPRVNSPHNDGPECLEPAA